MNPCSFSAFSSYFPTNKPNYPLFKRCWVFKVTETMSLQGAGEKRNKTKVSSVALVELVDCVAMGKQEEWARARDGGQTYVLICRKLNAKQRGEKNVAKNKDGYEMHRRQSPQSDTLHGKARVIASWRMLRVGGAE